MLKTEFLPDDTRRVFDYIAKSEDFRKARMTLMGGTALSLIIGHRLSEDLDFFSFQMPLPGNELKSTISQLKSDSYHVENMMSQSKISQARINGISLEEHIQEYAINGVKVSFGVMSKGGDARRSYFESAPTVDFDGAFSIPDLTTLFESKSVVLMDRVKSRDLFDLMVLIQDHGFTVKDMVQSIMTVDDVDETTALSALEVLLGNIPLDENDPGFESISLDVDMDDIYAFFAEKVNDYEIEVATPFLKN